MLLTEVCPLFSSFQLHITTCICNTIYYQYKYFSKPSGTWINLLHRWICNSWMLVYVIRNFNLSVRLKNSPRIGKIDRNRKTKCIVGKKLISGNKGLGMMTTQLRVTAVPINRYHHKRKTTSTSKRWYDQWSYLGAIFTILDKSIQYNILIFNWIYSESNAFRSSTNGLFYFPTFLFTTAFLCWRLIENH